jgi:hypothetical protein
MISGGLRSLRRLGQVAVHVQGVVHPPPGERPAGWCRPEAGDDRQLLFESLEARRAGWEIDTIGHVLLFVVTRPQSQLDAATTHDVDLCGDHRQCSGIAEGGGRDESAEAQRRGLARQASQRDPRIGRRTRARNRGQEVVRPEQAVEPGFLGYPGDGQDLFVTGGVLPSHEEPHSHRGFDSKMARGLSTSIWWISASETPASRKAGRTSSGMWRKCQLGTTVVSTSSGMWWL